MADLKYAVKMDKIDEESQTIYKKKGKIFSWYDIAYRYILVVIN